METAIKGLNSIDVLKIEDWYNGSLKAYTMLMALSARRDIGDPKRPILDGFLQACVHSATVSSNWARMNAQLAVPSTI